VDTEQVSPSQLPARSLYEYCFDINDGCWRSWRSYVSAYVPPADGQFSKILVPTADVIRTTWLVKTVAGAGHPCLLVGESGTAKTVTITKFLDGLDPTSMLARALYFSSRTSSADVQLAIEDATEKRTKVRAAVGQGHQQMRSARPPGAVLDMDAISAARVVTTVLVADRHLVDMMPVMRCIAACTQCFVVAEGWMYVHWCLAAGHVRAANGQEADCVH
jgi:hypothetical protein